MERNSELFSLPLKGSEGNSESSLLFLFNGTEFRVVFSSVGRVRNGIPRFSVPRNSRNSVGNNHLFRLFRLPRNYFFVGNSQPYTQTSNSLHEPDMRISMFNCDVPQTLFVIIALLFNKD